MRKKIQFFVMGMLAIACSSQHSENATEGNSAIKVTTETVRLVKGASELHYSGTVEPSQTIPLTFQSNGIVSAVLVQAGDMVSKGQLLATVDKADNESLYTASLAKYNQAKDAYNRLKSVHDNGSLPEIKWVEMETNLAQAESQMQLTKSNLEKCNMRAPESGMIGTRNIEPGQSSLTTGSPIQLVKIESVYIKIAVPENEINRMHKGMKATLTISALDGRAFEGEVSNVGVVADRFSRTYEAKIRVKNPKLDIKPGMVCDVVVNTGSQRDALVIPYNAVSKDTNGQSFVYMVSKDKKTVKKQHITLGNYADSGVEVMGGLSLGQTIVCEGKEKLSDNSQISL